MSDYRLEWNQERFLNQVRADLVANGEIVGEFVESEARKRLLSISDPTWGKAYREQVVSRLLMNKIEQKSKEIDIIIGVARSRSGSHHGFYIELGSSTAPAHPFLRPAIWENAKKIISLLEGR